MAATATLPEPLQIADLERIEKGNKLAKVDSIDPNQTYTAIIQLGSSRRWRSYGGGKVRLDRSGEDPVKVMVPVIRRTKPISGRTLQGLIQSQIEWWKNYKSRTPEGHPTRQLIVHNWDVVEGPPQERRTNVNGLDPRTEMMIKTTVASAVQEAVREVMAAFAK